MLVVKELLVDVVLLYSAETVVLEDGVLLDRAEEEFQCYRRNQHWHCFERQRLEFPIVHKLNKRLPVSTTSVACVTLW